MRLHYIQHTPEQCLGQLARWCGTFVHKLTYTRTFENDLFPNPENVDYLVILGGPTQIEDEHNWCWFDREFDFIRKYLRSKKPVLGLGFGAQILAKALGGRVNRTERPTLGFNLLTVRQYSWLEGLIGRKPRVFECRAGQIIPPKGATTLVSDQNGDCQGFSYMSHVLGFHFHLQFSKPRAMDIARDLISQYSCSQLTHGFDALEQVMPSRFTMTNRALSRIIEFQKIRMLASTSTA